MARWLDLARTEAQVVLQDCRYLHENFFSIHVSWFLNSVLLPMTSLHHRRTSIPPPLAPSPTERSITRLPGPTRPDRNARSNPMGNMALIVLPKSGSTDTVSAAVIPSWSKIASQRRWCVAEIRCKLKSVRLIPASFVKLSTVCSTASSTKALLDLQSFGR